MPGIKIKKGESVFVSKKDTKQIDSFLRCVGWGRKLSPQEETSLAFSSDPRKIQKLIKHNTLFVVSVAKHFKKGVGAMLPMEDLLQEVYAGLVYSVERWDPTRGFRLISYASNRMWWNVSTAVSSYGYPVQLPANGIALKRKLDEFVRKYEQENLVLPIFPDIARELGEGGRNKIHNLLIVYRLKDFNIGVEEIFKVRINNENFMENSVTPLDIFPDEIFSVREEKKYLRDAFYLDIKSALNTILPEKNVLVLSLWFGLWDLVDETSPYKSIVDEMRQISFRGHVSIEDISYLIGLSGAGTRSIILTSLKKIRESPTLFSLFEKHLDMLAK